jgi:hypothetical protein
VTREKAGSGYPRVLTLHPLYDSRDNDGLRNQQLELTVPSSRIKAPARAVSTGRP